MKLDYNTEASINNFLKKLSDIIKIILDTMTEESQYDDFANEFYNIAVLIDIINNIKLIEFYDLLMDELYKSRGNLDCCKKEIELLLYNVVNYEI